MGKYRLLTPQFFGWCAFATLVVVVLTSRRDLVYDEPAYIGLADQLAKRATMLEWYLGNQLGPTGPLHAYLHNTISLGQGHLPAPWFRIVNPLLLLGIVYLIGDLFRINGEPDWKAWCLMGLPVTWVVAGMALTEIPAMVGLVLGIWATERLRQEENIRPICIASGVLVIGIIVMLLGRQTYLAALPALAWRAITRRNWMWVGWSCLLGVAPLMVLFYIWGGVVPPLLGYVGGGLEFGHAFSAFCYLGIFILILAPGMFLKAPLRTFVFGVGSIVLNGILFHEQFLPMKSVQSVLLEGRTAEYVAMVVNIVFVFIGGGCVSVLLGGIAEKPATQSSCAALGLLLLCGACAAVVHLFSSRYVGMATPFLILFVRSHIQAGVSLALRMLAGAGLGFAALLSYHY